MEAEADILEAIAGFIDNCHVEVTTLLAPQVHALLDHMHAHWAGSNSFLDAVKQGTSAVRPESYLSGGPYQLLQSFFNGLPDSQAHLTRGSRQPTELEEVVITFKAALQTCTTDATADLHSCLTSSVGCKELL